MNDDRRKRISAAAAKIAEARAELEEVQGEEQDAYDAMPESFQNGEKGKKAQAAIDALEEAVGSCNDIEMSLETAIE